MGIIKENQHTIVKSSELRIGNWVNDLPIEQGGGGNGFMQVDAMVLSDIGMFDLHPIPLTPEILQKCGFKKDSNHPGEPYSSIFNLDIAVKGENKNVICVLIQHEGEKIICGNATVNDYWASNNFRSLHQLQNLYFALTGEELNINI